MPYAIRNKKNKKWLYGTGFRYSQPHQRLSDDTPYLYPTQSLAELALKVRRCNADYEIVKVDAEPVRHGRWKHYARMVICSECRIALYDDVIKCFRGVPRYCPECGARMDKE